MAFGSRAFFEFLENSLGRNGKEKRKGESRQTATDCSLKGWLYLGVRCGVCCAVTWGETSFLTPLLTHTHKRYRFYWVSSGRLGYICIEHWRRVDPSHRIASVYGWEKYGNDLTVLGWAGFGLAERVEVSLIHLLVIELLID